MILKEKMKFPSGTATARVIKVLHSGGGQPTAQPPPKQPVATDLEGGVAVADVDTMRRRSDHGTVGICGRPCRR